MWEDGSLNIGELVSVRALTFTRLSLEKQSKQRPWGQHTRGKNSSFPSKGSM